MMCPVYRHLSFFNIRTVSKSSYKYRKREHSHLAFLGNSHIYYTEHKTDANSWYFGLSSHFDEFFWKRALEVWNIKNLCHLFCVLCSKYGLSQGKKKLVDYSSFPKYFNSHLVFLTKKITTLRTFGLYKYSMDKNEWFS